MTDLFPAKPTNPTFSEEQALRILRDAWGVSGTLSGLGSMQDQNFRVRGADGGQWVAKIVGPHATREAIDLQNAAMHHVAARRDGFISPAPVSTRDGRDTVDVADHTFRLLSWIDGIPLSVRAYLSSDDLVQLGALAARVARALEGFDHPALTWDNGWDVRLAGRVLAESIPYVRPAWEPYLRTAIGAFEASVGRVAADLPVAVIHGDLTPVNTVCLPSDELRSTPMGVLDFGDVMRTWRIGDVAAAAVGAVEHPGTGDTLDAVLAILQGYHEVTPLTEVEVEALWPLVVARAAVTAAISHRQVADNTGNDYAQQAVESGSRAMRRVAAVPPALAVAAARERVGLPPVRADVAAAARSRLASAPISELVPGLQQSELSTVDLSVSADAFAYGEWTDAGALRDLIAADATVRIGRWGEPRLVGASRPHHDPQTTLQLGVDVFVPAGTPVSAPIAGRVQQAGADHVTIALGPDAGGLLMRISGIETSPGVHAGWPLDSGARIGAVAFSIDLLPSRVHLQLMHAESLPTQGHPGHRVAWLALCPDPSLLIGVDAAADAEPDAATKKLHRESVVAQPQHLYYDRPTEIVRGWRHHLFDGDGRCYLDMINNIAAIGHSHPRVTDAAVRQLRRLNTNSRFLYDSMAHYAERIAALLPPALDRVILVNSGSEAADLALQLAQRYTGRRDVIALAGAYHGWTGAVIDISTSPVDRPNWRAELPSWVHVAEQPDTYRGAHGADAQAYRVSVRAACAAGSGPAAFISEPLLGNQGGLELPPGYLRGVYEDVRAAGGLCVADEVQVGMARTGETFWAFEHEDVVPDIVFTAKATGNGHPLGVVVCRREIADSFDGQTAYFSSTGGGPVSCEIGLAVLDTIRDEGLQENARVVGGYLKTRLQELAERHPLIGAIHGRGLYLGIDLVLDRERRTPARYEALAVSERLRSLGIIMAPTGDAFNVLKVKPPMCIDRASADYFLATLDGLFAELT